MLRRTCRYSTLSHALHHSDSSVPLQNAYRNCLDSLKRFDKSSYVLSAYIPEPVRGTFIAIRCFQIEMSKIQKDVNEMKSPMMKGTGLSSSDFKLKFWKELLKKSVFDETNDKAITEPIAVLLKDSLKKGFNLEERYFDQIISTKSDFLQSNGFRTVDELSSYGEGYYSQFNYLIQNLLLSEQLSPSSIRMIEQSSVIRNLMVEIVAHIGQATGIASVVIGSKYYAIHKNQVYLPIDLMTKNELSQEDLLRLFQGHLKDDVEVRSKLKDVIYETCIVSNDHLLTARSKLQNLKEEIDQVIAKSKDEFLLRKWKKWQNGIPDCIYIPFMNSLPVDGYLKQLEKCDFDVVNKNIENSYWRLIWNSYKSYKKRDI